MVHRSSKLTDTAPVACLKRIGSRMCGNPLIIVALFMPVTRIRFTSKTQLQPSQMHTVTECGIFQLYRTPYFFAILAYIYYSYSINILKTMTKSKFGART